MVEFRSVRGDEKAYSFEDALFTGYATDGGMLMPAEMPLISPSTLQEWSQMGYTDLCHSFLSRFISPDLCSHQELKRIINAATASFTLTSSSSAPNVDVVGIRTLTSQLRVCELWHGPTLAFKDIPLQIIGEFFGHFLSAKRNAFRRLNILIGTSGDTGSAAIEAVKRHAAAIDIYVLFPLNRISIIQQRQMTTVLSPNVHVIGCDGSSDDLDAPIKHLLNDAHLKEKYQLTSINSINISRIIIQAAHIFFAILNDQGATFSAPIDSSMQRPLTSLCIPTGAAGHLIASIMAKRMGCPIHRIIPATNRNDILHTFLSTGHFYPHHHAVTVTHSPACDITVPYNIERLLYLIYTEEYQQSNHQNACKQVKFYMNQLEDNGGFSIALEDITKFTTTVGIVSYVIDDSQCLSSIKRTYATYDYLIDPHSALSVAAAELFLANDSGSSSHSIICLSTAHPAKFASSLAVATGRSEQELMDIFRHSPYDNVRRVVDIGTLPERMTTMPHGTDWTEQLRQTIQQNTLTRN